MSKYPKSFIHRQLDNEDVKNNLAEFSMARRYGNPFSNHEFVPYSNYESVPFSNYDRSISSVRNRKMNSFETNEYLTGEYKNKQIVNLLNRQTILMKELAQVMEMERSALRSQQDFDVLLHEIDVKKLKTTTAATNTTSTTVQPKRNLSTVMTIVDETEVRTALKKDPLVMRILKLANLKRAQYIESANKLLNM